MRGHESPSTAPVLSSAREGAGGQQGHARTDPYAGSPPWDIGRPQPAFLALAVSGAIRGRVLDVGCGTGEHVLMASRHGLAATGVDIAPAALRIAEDKARSAGLAARFLLHDATELADLGGRFDTVLDCGLFHVVAGLARPALVRSVRSVLDQGSRLFLLGGWGPHPLERDEITGAFTDGWRVDALERTTIDVTIQPDGMPAWLGALTAT